MSTRLGGCTGDLRSCANVPSMGGQILFLNVVLCLFGHQQLGNKGKIPDGPCFMESWGLLGKSHHFRQWRTGTRAYEHRLGPNSGRSLTENRPCSPLRLGKAYNVLGPSWTTFFIFAVLTLTLGIQMKTLCDLSPKMKKVVQEPNL